MKINVIEEPMTSVAELARIPISFEVDRVFDVIVQDQGLGGFLLSERRFAVPYIKDYDAFPGEDPAQWAGQFDMSNWGLIGAHLDGVRVGGAVVAWNTKGVDMLEDRTDLAVLWNIRVSPEVRGQGVGSAILEAAAAWAKARGCRQLKIETQNINVPACRFYARQGCVLGAIHRFAYPALPDEVQLLWYKDLS